MKNLYFIRHGESEGNAGDFIGGQTDWKLTEKGITQAKAAGKYAAEMGMHFDAIISSPLSRAFETAKQISEAIGNEKEQIIVMNDLQERSLGEWKGLHHDDMDVSREEYYTKPSSVDHVPGVETSKQLNARARKVLESLKNNPSKTILVVSHAGFGRSLRRAIIGSGYDDPVESFNNAEIIKLI